MTDEAAVTHLFDTVASAFGRVDLLFNNAGINVAGGAIDTLEASDWRCVIATNLTGAFLCLQAAFRQMKRRQPQGGRIINNGSISAHSPRPDSIAYMDGLPMEANVQFMTIMATNMPFVGRG